ncbi:MAG: RNA pseudouridine synthase, partial [Clostridia bacterium]|nr:RNA pseudouridine synthase [Clostridia bacterium]
KQMAVTDKNSKEAITHYEVLARYGGFTHIKCILETGRTHQIRVHMSSIGHPIAGDDVYGPKKVETSLCGQCLHAKKLGFIHPNGEYMEFDSVLPEYFTKFLAKLERKEG